MAALDATQVVAAPQKKRNSAFLGPLGTSNDRTRRAKGPFVKTPRLPKNHTDSLTARIKKLVSLWADEEIMNGNQVFCKYSESIKAFSFIATLSLTTFL